ncbi:MAG: SDR family oxidoreductase [Chitinophagaceae bacterium]
MAKENYRNKVVVITGGSSGIGLALAHAFVKQGSNITLVARDAEKLARARLELEQQLAGSSAIIHIVPADVSDKDSITAAIQSIGDRFEQIDVLINCAGITSCGRFTDQPLADLEKVMQTNYLGALYASRAAWPYLKKAKGQLSFVSSVAGYMGLIGYSSYAPSKFALTGLAECLRMEGCDDGIRVSVIYPPDTDTSMLAHEKKHGLPETLALSENIRALSPDRVAAAYLRGLQRGRFDIYCDGQSRPLRWLKTIWPGLFYHLTDRVVKKTRRHTI